MARHPMFVETATLNTIKMPALPKLIHRFNEITIPIENIQNRQMSKSESRLVAVWGCGGWEDWGKGHCKGVPGFILG